MKSSKTKITMLLTVLFMCVMLVPAVKAEAYGIRQITAGANDAAVVWDADTDSDLQGWVVYLNGQQIATLNPNETSFQFAGLTQGYPYAAQVYSVYKRSYSETPVYLKKGETVLKTKPSKIEKTDIICDVCGKEMVIKIGKFGKFLAIFLSLLSSPTHSNTLSLCSSSFPFWKTPVIWQEWHSSWINSCGRSACPAEPSSPS